MAEVFVTAADRPGVAGRRSAVISSVPGLAGHASGG